MQPHPALPPQSFRQLANQQLPPLEPSPVDAPRLPDTKMSVGEPSKPVLGLPLTRWIPQDCHSFMDYANGLAAAACAMSTNDTRARLASIALASSVLAVSSVTDCRLSVVRALPIEAHEVIDHVWGLSAIAAPFVLGYWKSAPKIAIAHIGAGIGAIVGSLLTDYRAYSKRSSR
jgi:hypothetical protein